MNIKSDELYISILTNYLIYRVHFHEENHIFFLPMQHYLMIDRNVLALFSSNKYQ